jgi:hypothetical protein
MDKIIAIKRRGAAALFVAAAVASMASCTLTSSPGDFSTATGKPYELIVSVDQQLWDGPVGDTVRSIFAEPVHMFNQPEPMFDVMRTNPSALKGIILRHRNILDIKVTPEVAKPAAAVQHDIYAKPQTIITVAAPDAKGIVEYLTEHRTDLQQIFEKAERSRSLAASRKYKEKDLEAEILQTFGMKVDIPKGYAKRNGIGGDFLWISNEQAITSQGIIIYSYPYAGGEDLLPENLLARRNEFVGKVPGPSEGSYMTTADFEPDVRYIRINGRAWAEMRGLWDVEGNFMGGPFVSYSTVDAATNRIVTLDCYVFSPKSPKRNLMHSLEHIIFSVDFPDGTAL